MIAKKMDNLDRDTNESMDRWFLTLAGLESAPGVGLGAPPQKDDRNFATDRVLTRPGQDGVRIARRVTRYSRNLWNSVTVRQGAEYDKLKDPKRAPDLYQWGAVNQHNQIIANIIYQVDAWREVELTHPGRGENYAREDGHRFWYYKLDVMGEYLNGLVLAFFNSDLPGRPRQDAKLRDYLGRENPDSRAAAPVKAQHQLF